jgi:hypothetical protein
MNNEADNIKDFSAELKKKHTKYTVYIRYDKGITTQFTASPEYQPFYIFSYFLGGVSGCRNQGHTKFSF